MTAIAVTPELTKAAEMVRHRRGCYSQQKLRQSQRGYSRARGLETALTLQMVRDAEQDLADLILAAMETT